MCKGSEFSTSAANKFVLFVFSERLKSLFDSELSLAHAIASYDVAQQSFCLMS